MQTIKFYRQSKKKVKKPGVFMPSQYFQGNTVKWTRFLGAPDMVENMRIYQVSAYKIPFLNIAINFGEVVEVEINYSTGWN